jgi:hypothetical protein
MKFRFGQELDFQTNMSYRCYITEVHFVWECPHCGISYNQFHEDGCTVQRIEDGSEIGTKVLTAIP